ncbi:MULTISPECIES: 5-dehydro-2-deoxygluconokinase [unclassified Devosia]|uniref:bifunctional 5-dehydro-2-deoxygluconokinase/5-dehydro-2- deoxyphosphogluconate aldolase n=1 Tax=unclassified Devosia TaxID=196773 RepID=UPI00145ED060|nr:MULTISPECIES: 5-dehydro-2-deoxygluconokinase [unclassified Devosia]MBJ6985847.1 5-dehydro-2-deoxygluconokinase [Devosia sp. MC521]QMW61224.1 5-dehydro-2-deoxygluconokinase [Devosia sp. MC521]
MSEVHPTLDIITLGRASVDLYGQQIGTRLEDTVSFAKSVGGCPANIAIGSARLGLKSAWLGRVGNEQFGRYITEQMAREGASTDGITIDPTRLTALAILGIEDDKKFPLLFYRENCADMALSEDDVDETFILSAGAILVTGTHFSRANTAAAQFKAIKIARENGMKVVFDIDYRPNLWGLAGHNAGEERYIASDTVSQKLRDVLPHCDLIVGTEEEVLIGSGADDLHEALRTIRAHSSATIVLKRGPMGCIVYEGDIPNDLEDGIIGQGFPIEVYNTLGAGDAFMSGFLRGWLRNEPLDTCATWANACGAFAVSRLLCSAEIPSFVELQDFLAKGSSERALRKDARINHIHWATTARRRDYPTLKAFAIDHRIQLEDVADRLGAPREKISEFKVLAVQAAARVADGRNGFGMLLDDKYGRDALFAASKVPDFWISKPLEEPGSRPLRFEFSQDVGSRLVEWPIDHCIKCLCFYHPDDPADLRATQIDKLKTLHEAARKIGRELLVEIIAGKHGKLDANTIARALQDVYDAGIKPDWWKLEPQASPEAWVAIDDTIERNDPLCRGVVLLGLEAPRAELEAAFKATTASRTVKGFAVGRTLFASAAEKWLAGTITDAEAVEDMAQRFAELVSAWEQRGNA